MLREFELPFFPVAEGTRALGSGRAAWALVTLKVSELGDGFRRRQVVDDGNTLRADWTSPLLHGPSLSVTQDATVTHGGPERRVEEARGVGVVHAGMPCRPQSRRNDSGNDLEMILEISLHERDLQLPADVDELSPLHKKLASQDGGLEACVTTVPPACRIYESSSLRAREERTVHAQAIYRRPRSTLRSRLPRLPNSHSRVGNRCGTEPAGSVTCTTRAVCTLGAARSRRLGGGPTNGGGRC